ncbi:MAG: ChuX/HutX family heme-like substrate-binding protein [Pseudomonadota bacterium]
MKTKDPAAIRAAIEEKSTLRPRDIAHAIGVSEAAVAATDVGRTMRRIEASPDRLMPHICDLGDVMALTRNESAVHERTGRYEEWHSGSHASMVLGSEIDLRIFPRHWCHGFAYQSEGNTKGPTRSIQIFDTFGEAVHKVYPRDGTDLDLWDRMVNALATNNTSDSVTVEPLPDPEGAKTRPEKADALREAWRRMTDTHQFLRLVSKFRMNRLGAYRIAGAPFARPLAPQAVDAALGRVAENGTQIMLFVGNRGCIQIHSGKIETLKQMGPWQNVLDERFNLHLRIDQIAEAWLVQKPTKRGMALSVEAFDAEGRLILQLFGLRKEHADYTHAFAEMAEALPVLETVE